MGARVVLGRDFTDADAAPEPRRRRRPHPPGSAAILSYEYWQRRYGGNPGVLGTEMPGSGQGGPRIVGVLAPGFRLFLPPAPGWMPPPISALPITSATTPRTAIFCWPEPSAGCKPGVTLPQAQERIRAMSPELQKASFDRKAVLSLEPMQGTW